MDICIILGFTISLTLSYISLPLVIRMLEDANITCENYKSNLIPTSIGIGFVFIQVLTLGILGVLNLVDNKIHLIYLLGFVFIGFLGLLDDFIEDKKTKGLKGHLKALLKGILTTGGLKAFLGFFISLVISIYLSDTFINIIINSLIVGLFTNFINIFDLRPGRAIKIFTLFAMIFIITGYSNTNNYILTSIFGILIPYILLDIKGRVMMGDVGSNTLGFSLGIYTVLNYNLLIRIIVLTLLILTHAMAERISFSKIIDNNKTLKYLDNLGR